MQADLVEMIKKNMLNGLYLLQNYYKVFLKGKHESYVLFSSYRNKIRERGSANFDLSSYIYLDKLPQA